MTFHRSLWLGFFLAGWACADVPVALTDSAQMKPASMGAVQKSPPLDSARAAAPKAPPSTHGSSSRSDFRTGRAAAKAGQALAIFGLVAAPFGAWVDFPPLAFIGATSYAIGIPILGFGASSMAGAAAKSNPRYHPSYWSWAWYGSGLAMSVAGATLLNDGIMESNGATTDGERNSSSSTIVNGALLLTAGSLCNIVAWLKFSFLTDDALEAVNLAYLEAAPYLYLARDGHAAPGLLLAYRF